MSSQSYSVMPDLPPSLEGLAALATDLRFSWSHTADALWQRIDEDLFDLTRNPWLVLQSASREKLQELAEDENYCAQLQRLQARERSYMASPRWFEQHHKDSALKTIAYFSLEFGLSEALPIYSGGLGLLAGDHLKASHDLGVPLVGVGLLYQNGYFRQALDVDGTQIALYPSSNVSELPVQPVRDKHGKRLRLEFMLPGHALYVRVWQAKIGLITLYLLDTNDPGNHPVDRCITTELYGGGKELRLAQEILLGIGGWRVLKTLGIDAEVCHLNEGHAAFAVLERARYFMLEHKLDFETALTITRAGNLFTTHTPVEAGFDRYPPALVHRYFEGYADCLNIPCRRLMALGRLNENDMSEPFNMAYLAIRGSGAVNGVSRLHGEVSRQIFAPLFPHWPLAEVPVKHVTNGVHASSWDSAAADELWTRACGKQRWMGDLAGMEEKLRQVPSEEIWDMRQQNRAELVKFVRGHHAQQLRRHGMAQDEAMELGRQVFDANILTLGFARRFAAYKRPTLLLQDPERFVRILTHSERPVQMVIAGKAHPQDEPGKDMVRQWFQFMQRPEVRHHLVFVPDYNILIAERLVQGVDVWINTPRRPWEASGTSGMKVLVNGGLNLSELDGWWAEAYDPPVGWALGDGQQHDGDPDWDRAEAEQLYRLLEEEIVPAFYARNDKGIPQAWVDRIHHSMAHLTPRYSTNRMVREYVEEFYLPLATEHVSRADSGGARGKALQRWRHDLDSFWESLHMGEARVERNDDHYHIRLPLVLGEIGPQEVRVEVYADADGDGTEPVRLPMRIESPLVGSLNGFLYEALVPNHRSLDQYTIRIVPAMDNANVPLETHHIYWKHGLAG